MIISSDGKQFIWVIFDSDGYECSDFVGAFVSEDEAMKVCQLINEMKNRFYAEILKTERLGTTEVKMVTLGEYQLPADTDTLVLNIKE